MDNLWITFLIILVFFFAPVVGLFSILTGIQSSRRWGKDFDKLHNALEQIKQMKHENYSGKDIAYFDSEISDWLETAIRETNTRWAKTTVRLLIEAKVIGLGEQHRDKLIEDKKYQKKITKILVRLSSAFDNGDIEEITVLIGRLFSLIECGYWKKTSANTVELASNTLMSAAEELSSGYSEASDRVANGIEQLKESGNYESAGLPLLVLQWAKLRLKYRSANENMWYSIVITPTIRFQLQRMARCLMTDNVRGISDVISKTL